jgi:hypothetical protein
VKGKIVIIKTDGTKIVKHYDRPPPLADLQAAVGGYIELALHLSTYDGKPCRTFVNEMGKLVGLPLNPYATALADQSMFLVFNGKRDYFVGDVCIVQGDEAFMREL